jgi:uncharacterized protein YndB with AHSA1/START domain
MDKSLIVSQNIQINASAETIWEALTNPEKIKVYLFGTETITDWKVGSPIVFQGEYDGRTYKDKGNVLECIPNSLIKYNYWSGFSGLEDTLENYSIVTYNIEQSAKNTHTLNWTQEGFTSEENKKHSESGLTIMLEQIKELTEN